MEAPERGTLRGGDLADAEQSSELVVVRVALREEVGAREGVLVVIGRGKRRIHQFGVQRRVGRLGAQQCDDRPAKLCRYLLLVFGDQSQQLVRVQQPFDRSRVGADRSAHELHQSLLVVRRACRDIVQVHRVFEQPAHVVRADGHREGHMDDLVEVLARLGRRDIAPVLLFDTSYDYIEVECEHEHAVGH